MSCNLHGGRFTLASNSAGNAVPGETVFEFEQDGIAVRACYSGGGIRTGAMVGHFTAPDILEVLFQQVTMTGLLQGGEGLLRIDPLPDGRLRFLDDWRFLFNGSGGGQAIWEETGT